MTCSCVDGFWRKHLPCCRNIDTYRKLLLGPKVTKMVEDMRQAGPYEFKARLRLEKTSFRDVLRRAKWLYSISVSSSSGFEKLTEEMKAQNPELQAVLKEIHTDSSLPLLWCWSLCYTHGCHSNRYTRICATRRFPTCRVASVVIYVLWLHAVNMLESLTRCESILRYLITLRIKKYIVLGKYYLIYGRRMLIWLYFLCIRDKFLDFLLEPQLVRLAHKRHCSRDLP